MAIILYLATVIYIKLNFQYYDFVAFPFTFPFTFSCEVEVPIVSLICIRRAKKIFYIIFMIGVPRTDELKDGEQEPNPRCIMSTNVLRYKYLS